MRNMRNMRNMKKAIVIHSLKLFSPFLRFNSSYYHPIQYLFGLFNAFHLFEGK